MVWKSLFTANVEVLCGSGFEWYGKVSSQQMWRYFVGQGLNGMEKSFHSKCGGTLWVRV